MRDARAGSEVLGFEQSCYPLPQIQRSPVDHPRGNLFATDLKKKVRHLGKILFSQTPELHHKVPAIVTLHTAECFDSAPEKTFHWVTVISSFLADLGRFSGSFSALGTLC